MIVHLASIWTLARRLERVRRLRWALTPMAMALVMSSMLAVCGSEEVVVTQINSEDKVQPVRFGHSNIYLIQTEGGHILVDAGMPDMEEELDAVFRESGVDPKRVQLIVATHGHLDHVGTIAYAQEATGGEILCHRSLAEYLAAGEAEPAVARNLLGRLLNFLTGLQGSGFSGAEPDILVDEEYDLAAYGISGKIIHTPGHSPGSVSVILDNGEALIGDLVRKEGSDRIGLGMFYEDKNVLLDSLEKVAAFEPRIVYLSHGTHIDNRALKEAIEANR
jgi:glyoxylase-like metal-dependent hydrolase (beta-lactamase superfamily II)